MLIDPVDNSYITLGGVMENANDRYLSITQYLTGVDTNIDHAQWLYNLADGTNLKDTTVQIKNLAYDSANNVIFACYNNNANVRMGLII